MPSRTLRVKVDDAKNFVPFEEDLTQCHDEKLELDLAAVVLNSTILGSLWQQLKENLSQVHSIALDDNDLDDETWTAIASTLPPLSGLTTLTISNCRGGSRQGLAMVLAACSKLQSLETLDVAMDGLQVETCSAHMNRFLSLTTLILDANPVCDFLLELASHLSSGSTRLKTLSARNCGLSLSDIVPFVEPLLSETASLSSLRVGNIYVTPKDLAESGEIKYSGVELTRLDYHLLFHVLADSTHIPAIRTVTVGSAALCGLDAEGKGERDGHRVHDLVSLLGCNAAVVGDRLLSLNLASNCMNDDLAACLAPGLAVCTCLQSLDLSFNQLGVEGMKGLKESLPGTVNTLLLTNNPLRLEGGKVVAEMLREWSLTHLNLRGCGLGPDGILALAVGIAASHTLDTLDISQNSLDARSKAGLGDMLCKLEVGPPLQNFTCDDWSVSDTDMVLDLSRSSLREPDVRLLAGILARHSVVQVLNLDDNPALGRGSEPLLRVLEHRNGVLQLLSLNGTSMPSSTGSAVQRLLRSKPGLRVTCLDGNGVTMSDRVNAGIATQLHANTELHTGTEPVSVVKLHVLGETGAGRKALVNTLGRSRLRRLFTTDTTALGGLRGLSVTALELLDDTASTEGGSPGSSHSVRYSVWDYGGGRACDAALSLNLLRSPCSVTAILVSLTEPRVHIANQLAYWLRVVLSADNPAGGTPLLIVGTNADRVGEAGIDILRTTWQAVQRRVLDDQQHTQQVQAELFALDCRQSTGEGLAELKRSLVKLHRTAVVDAELTFPHLRVNSSVARCVARWRSDDGGGHHFFAMADFHRRVAAECLPGVPLGAVVTICRALHQSGELLFVEQGRASDWVIIDVDWFGQELLHRTLDSPLLSELLLPSGPPSSSSSPSTSSSSSTARPGHCLPRAALQQLFDRSLRCPEAERPLLQSLLCGFGLASPVSHAGEAYLVMPLRVSQDSEQHDDLWQDTELPSSGARSSATARLRYRGPLLPRGLVARVQAKLVALGERCSMTQARITVITAGYQVIVVVSPDLDTPLQGRESRSNSASEDEAGRSTPSIPSFSVGSIDLLARGPSADRCEQLVSECIRIIESECYDFTALRLQQVDDDGSERRSSPPMPRPLTSESHIMTDTDPKQASQSAPMLPEKPSSRLVDRVACVRLPSARRDREWHHLHVEVVLESLTDLEFDGAKHMSTTDLPAARVKAVNSRKIVTHFHDFGTKYMSLVGMLVLNISHESWAYHDHRLPLVYHEVVQTLKNMLKEHGKVYVQLCPPAAAYTRLKSVRLYQSLISTTRAVDRGEDGDYELSPNFHPELSWFVVTVAIPTNIPLFGKNMITDLGDFAICGTYQITAAEAMEAINEHPTKQVLGLVHGFATTPFYSLALTALYSRELDQPLVVMFSWPSNPGTSWLVRFNLVAKYTQADQHMQASIMPFMNGIKLLRTSTNKKIFFKCHSLGCNLILNVIERMNLHGEHSSKIFSKVILDAPDTPTWYFAQVVSAAAGSGVRFLHLFNPKDRAVEASREQRQMEKQCPGNDPVVQTANVQVVNCKRTVSSSNLNHDYGRYDGFVLMEQRDFLAGVSPQERLLDLVESGDTQHWLLRTGR